MRWRRPLLEASQQVQLHWILVQSLISILIRFRHGGGAAWWGGGRGACAPKARGMAGQYVWPCPREYPSSLEKRKSSKMLLQTPCFILLLLETTSLQAGSEAEAPRGCWDSPSSPSGSEISIEWRRHWRIRAPRICPWHKRIGSRRPWIPLTPAARKARLAPRWKRNWRQNWHKQDCQVFEQEIEQQVSCQKITNLKAAMVSILL